MCHSATGEELGEIEVEIEYRVLNHGSPARIRYDENHHPAEAAEVDVVGVTMAVARPLTDICKQIPAFDWLYEWASKYADENAEHLAWLEREKDRA